MPRVSAKVSFSKRCFFSHVLADSSLRTDDFEAFMLDRQLRLLALIEQATGQSV
jgi:hypothetical protein